MNQKSINIHDTLLSILKLKTPNGKNPANLLMELLSISKEAAYRRLRGEIQLSLDEAIVLAKELEVSLDNLISNHYENNYIFRISPFTVDLSMEKYYQTLVNIMNTYLFVKSDPDCFSYIVGKTLSPIFYFKYKEFTKFTLFKWIYLAQNDTKYATFSDVIIPAKLEQLFKPFQENVTQVPLTWILNDFLFTSLAKDLTYYFTINLLTKEEVEILKEQIFMLIDDLEEIAKRGHYENGAKILTYVADSYFDFSYNYIKGNGFESCGIGTYGLNFIACQNKLITNNQRIWIESIIKYSTSITWSGEAKRMYFFKRQRDKIKNISTESHQFNPTC